MRNFYQTNFQCVAGAVGRASGTFLAPAAAYAELQGKILALFAFRADPRTGDHDLHRADSVSGRSARRGDDLRAAPAADAGPDGLPPLAAQSCRLAAAGRGGALFSGPHQPDRLDGSQSGAGHHAPARFDHYAAQAHRGAHSRENRLQPLAGGEHLLDDRHDSQAGAVGRVEHFRFRGQYRRAAVRALLHAHRRPPHGGVLPRDKYHRHQGDRPPTSAT